RRRGAISILSASPGRGRGGGPLFPGAQKRAGGYPAPPPYLRERSMGAGPARPLKKREKVSLGAEPFGALDAQTRETMQGELLDIHARPGKTILFVTHDLDEAVLIADRIVLLREGV